MTEQPKNRLIEDSLPLEAISYQSTREKSIQHGHISMLHIWWARRPLSLMRAIIFSALTPSVRDEKQREYLHELIGGKRSEEIWEGGIADRNIVINGNNQEVQDAISFIQSNYRDRTLQVLDAFSGGGSGALEALRLGTDVDAVDVNPIAYLIGKGTLSYPQKYGQRLLSDFDRWAKFVQEEVAEELADYYAAPDVAYIWTYNLSCSNPVCRAKVPLIRDLRLMWGNKNSHRAALRLTFDDQRRPHFEVNYDDEIDFNAKESRVHRGRIECPVCSTQMDLDYLRSEAIEGRLEPIPVVAVFNTDSPYRFQVCSPRDFDQYRDADHQLYGQDQSKSSLELLPDEPIHSSRTSNLNAYGINYWRDVYNSRQLLQLSLLVTKSRDVYSKVLEETGDSEYARAIVTYLGFAIDHVANNNSILTSWMPTGGGRMIPSFSRQALAMKWDYVEIGPLSRYGWGSAIRKISSAIESAQAVSDNHATVHIGSVENIEEMDVQKEYDLIIADPPYYDSVMYSDLSDFFYVWQKRLLGHLYPEAFVSGLVSREDDIVFRKEQETNLDNSENTYMEKIGRSFSQLRNVLAPDGIVVSFAPFRSGTLGNLDVFFDKLIRAGLKVTALHPISTEIGSITKKKQEFRSSTLLVVSRKQDLESLPDGQYHRVRAYVRRGVRERLTVARKRESDADDLLILEAFLAAMEIYSQYAKVQHSDGSITALSDLFAVAEEELTDFLLLNGVSDGE